MTEEDKELEIIKAKKLAELAKKAQTKTKPKTPRDILLEKLVDRGDEVLYRAEKLYPKEMQIIVEKLAELISNGELDQNITGGELLQILKVLGLRVPIETKIAFYEDGKLISFQDKLKKFMDEG
ncbi:MAG: double-stranded DNA-binding protein [Nitrososphaeria archaeon]